MEQACSDGVSSPALGGPGGNVGPTLCIHGYGILTWAGGSEHPSMLWQVMAGVMAGAGLPG